MATFTKTTDLKNNLSKMNIAVKKDFGQIPRTSLSVAVPSVIVCLCVTASSVPTLSYPALE